MEVDHSRQEQHSTLPESIPQQGDVKYFVQPKPDDTPKYTYDSSSKPEPTPRNRYTTLPFLLLYALLLAVLSGLIGGFIGKAITESRHRTPSTTSTTDATFTGQCPSSPPREDTKTNPTIAPGPNTIQNNATKIALPITDCPRDNGNFYQSTFTKTPFRKFCNIDWVGNDMISFLALSMSDCIEACGAWNDNRSTTELCVSGTDGDNNIVINPAKECVGAMFAPTWAIDRNTSLAMSGTAANCFLKNRIDGFPANVQEKEGVEMVGLCLEGKCPT